MTWEQLLAERRVASQPTDRAEIQALRAVVQRNLADAQTRGLSVPVLMDRVASASVRRPQKPACLASAVFAGGAAWWPARPIQSGSAGFGSREGLLVIPREPPGRMLPRFLGMALQGVEIVQGVASTEPAGVD